MSSFTVAQQGTVVSLQLWCLLQLSGGRFFAFPSVCEEDFDKLLVEAIPTLGSIFAAFSSPVYVPPREEFGGGARAPFPNSGW